MQLPTPSMPVARLPALTEVRALTGLRGFAAFWVLLYHAWVAAGPRVMTLGSGDWKMVVTPAFSCGWAGVDIFFTLSAFLLSLPFVMWRVGISPRPSLRVFWQRRILRIFPAYYAQIAVLLILTGAFGIGTWPDLQRLFGNLLLWFNFGPGSVSPLNAVAYTLPIEFCFYLLLPLLACLLRPRWWIVLLLLAVLETQMYRHLMFDASATIEGKVVVLEQMPGRLDQFVFGMLAAYAYGRAASVGRLPGARACNALFLLGVAGIVGLLVLMQMGFEHYWAGSWLLFCWHGMMGVTVALMLFACAAGSRCADALLSNRPLHYLGVISFGVYLWHYPLMHWLDDAHAFDWISGYPLPLTVPVLLALSCAVASVSYWLIERPLLLLGRRRAKHPAVTTELTPTAHAIQTSIATGFGAQALGSDV